MARLLPLFVVPMCTNHLSEPTGGSNRQRSEENGEPVRRRDATAGTNPRSKSMTAMQLVHNTLKSRQASFTTMM